MLRVVQRFMLGALASIVIASVLVSTSTPASAASTWKKINNPADVSAAITAQTTSIVAAINAQTTALQNLGTYQIQCQNYSSSTYICEKINTKTGAICVVMLSGYTGNWVVTNCTP